MYNKALEVLNIFNNYGYVAYIVGGYPRDMILGIKTNDIDICTNAKPKEIINIFDTDSVSDNSYGSVRVIYKNCLFDVTTFRKDIKYEDNRKPIKIKYISDLKKDLLRRDFTINTMCIDKDGNIIDMLNAKDDIDKKVIKTVGNPRYRIKEDSLRILRAIRFASVLNFDIDDKTMNYIKKYGYLLKGLSYSRKKEELGKIFSAKNKEKGRRLILESGIDKYLEINNLKEIVMCDDIIGIWSQLDISNNYPFTKVEKEMIKNIRRMLDDNFDEYTVYKYGLYVNQEAGAIKGLNKKKITKLYNKLKIHSKKDLDITSDEIIKIINKPPGEYIKLVYKDLEKEVLYNRLKNNNKHLKKYIEKNINKY